MIQPFDVAADGWPHGPARVVLVGPPGTGKTHAVLTAWLLPALSAGANPREVLACSFTKAAAGEIAARVARELGGEARDFRLTSSTIHAEAYRLVRDVAPDLKVHEPGETLAPDDVEEDEAEVEDADLRAAAITVWDMARGLLAEGDTVLERIEGVAERFASDRRVARYDLHELAAEIEAYEEGKRKATKLDFCDMLQIALDRGEVPARELLVVDEAQDLSPLQWLLVASWARRARVVVVVGDPDQCAPPGSMVRVPGPEVREVPIESLRDGDRVVSYDRNACTVVGRAVGFPVRVGARSFSGELVQVVAGGKLTRTTPDHRWLARWAEPKDREAHVVYLMRRGLRYRVGWCKLFTNTETIFHLNQRANSEHADGAWILRVFRSRTEASVYESVVAARYGLPTCVFEPVDGANHLTAEAIEATFSALDGAEHVERADRCLRDHGRLPRHPLWPQPGDIPGAWRRWTLFEVHAANLESDLMSVPIPVRNEKPVTWEPIRVGRERYEGPVYSLDVEKHGTYVQDGLVTHNSIHKWAGADAMPLLHYARSPGWVVRRLAQSYRVPQRVHALARELILRDEERMDAPYEPAPRAGEVWEGQHLEALQVLEDAVRDQRSVLVLGRARRTLASGLASTMARNGIPYLCDKRRGYSPLGAPSALACARAVLAFRAGGLARADDVRQLLAALPAKGVFPPKRKKLLQVEVAAWPETCRIPAAALDALGITLGAVLEGDVEEALRIALDAKEGRDRPAEIARLVKRWGVDVLERDPVVTLTTMHASKGREADVVVLDLATPRPVARALAEGEGQADERRLLYVGLTRTRDWLLLVRSPGDLGELLDLGAVPVGEAVA